jgi:hypothetical protein
MTSDMIFIKLSSHNTYAGICRAEQTYHQTISLPYKRGTISRNCYYEHYGYGYIVSTYSHLKF